MLELFLHRLLAGPAKEFADAPELVRELALSHSPHADPLYCDWLIRQSVTALCEAYRKREEALLSVGSGREDGEFSGRGQYRRFHWNSGKADTRGSEGEGRSSWCESRKFRIEED